MEKIRLKNGITLLVPPMRIHKDAQFLKVSVLTHLDYISIESVIDIRENLEKIEYLGDDEEVLKTFNDCIKCTTLEKIKGGYEDEDGLHDLYHIEISCDAVTAKLESMDKEIAALKDENVLLRQENVGLKELVDALVIAALEV